MKHEPLDCRGCAFCCKMAGYVEVSTYDIRRLAKHLGLSVGEFEEKHVVYTTRAGKKRIKDELTTCQFLGKDHACTVYSARPTNCRGYVCWDQDDKTVYEFARFMQMPTAALRDKEADEARAEKEAARRR
ncbi:MAG TPA: YkgJ family cysteine cluster protein [Stellaceae bacterium]|jgi:Fe-S-cluster containining protein|nr:YkgJ family cysteine cluster protein [Stellaceae bacterium]